MIDKSITFFISEFRLKQNFWIPYTCPLTRVTKKNIRMNIFQSIKAFAITGALVLASSLSIGQDLTKVDITVFTQETQLWVRTDGKMSLTWWIPTEYWKIALASSPDVTDEVKDELEDTFKKYTLLCAVDATISATGSLITTPDSIINNSISIIDEDGTAHLPIPLDEQDESTKTILTMMRPVMAQALGQFGEGMNFYMFEISDKKGVSKIQAAKKGGFTVKHSDQEFVWSLPLSTLIPNLFCPVDNEQLSGKWNYCPIHGDKLKK